MTGACVCGQVGNVSLTVPAGTPLRLYVTEHFPKRQGTAVAAKVIEPVYAFDHQVIPAGSTVTGIVARTRPVRKRDRIRAILRGDFTPLKIPLVEFELLRLPDGRPIPLRTVETSGLNTFYVEHRPKPKPRAPLDPNAGTRKKLEVRIKNQVTGRVERLTDMVCGPGKMERLVDFALRKLPYHPQFVSRDTRFDAELSQGLSFGSEPVPAQEVSALGGAPPADSVIAARLLTPVDSRTARRGDAIQAILTEPVFDGSHRLVLPEGTRLDGAVVVTRKARWLHRGGRLRFTFSRLELAPEALALRRAATEEHTQAVLAAAEAGNGLPIKVDSEGGVKVSDPKTRFLAPLLSFMVASQASDFDAGMASRIGTGAANQGGRALVERRTLGGGLGFGLIGMAVSQSSPYVGMAMGYYGLAWSVFSNVISKGSEVRFDKNAALEIRFGGRRKAKGVLTGASKLLTSGAYRVSR